MVEWISAVLLCLGALFTLLAAVGIVRLPDLFTRMHAITKAGTLGVGLSLLGVAFFHLELGVATRALAVILFVLLTAPVASHLIGRAAYMAGHPLWEGTKADVLRDRSDAVASEEELARQEDEGQA